MRVSPVLVAVIAAICLGLAWRAAGASGRVHGARQAASGARVVVATAGDQLTFDPPRVVIRKGQTVEWQNQSRQVHNIVDDPAKATNAADVSAPAGAPAFDSGYLNPGQNYSHRFTVRGTYRYVCTLHEPQGMKGEVIVR